MGKPKCSSVGTPDYNLTTNSGKQEVVAKLKKTFCLDNNTCLPDPVPTSYYSNNVIPFELLNRFLIWLNQFYALLFRHLVQAPIQTRCTQRARHLYHEYAATFKQVTKSKRHRHHKCRKELELYWPERSERWIMFVLALECLLFIRLILTVAMMYNSAQRSVRLTVSESLNTINKQVYQLDEMSIKQVSSSNLSVFRSKNFETLKRDEIDIEQCYSRLVEFVGKRYGKFLFWNASIGYEAYPILNDFFFMEQSKPVQMFAEEVLSFAHIIGSFILFCGIFGSIVTFHIPYDVNPMLFVYDPTYCAFQVKVRLKHYLTEARLSYANFWSIYQLNKDFSLSMKSEGGNLLSGRIGDSSICGKNYTYIGSLNDSGHRKTQLRKQSDQYLPCLSYTRRNHFSQRHRLSTDFDPLNPLSSVQAQKANSKNLQRINSQVLSLRDDQYDQFIPDARSQGLRQVLLIGYPFSSTYTFALLSLSLTIVFVWSIHLNSTTMNLNKELRLFLSDGVEPEIFNETMTNVVKCPDDASMSLRPTEMLRASLIDYLGNQLARLNNSTIEHSSYPQIMSQNITNWLAQESRLVSAAVAPIVEPKLYHWTFPYCSSILAGTLCILYLTIFFVCVVDLCFWLFSLRMKLNICCILLKYYTDIQDLKLNSSHLLNLPPNDTLRQPSHPAATLNRIDDTVFGCSKSLIDELLPESVIKVSNNTTPTTNLNIGTMQVIKYALYNRANKNRVCHQFAKKLILIDCSSKWAGHIGSNIATKRNNESSLLLSSSFSEHLKQRPSDTFLMSAYLEFRLFLDQIDSCRQSVNVITAYGTIHSINIIVSSLFTGQLRSKVGFLLAGYSLVNLCLISASLFQSQCTKLIPPIYSILASSLKANKAVKHLATLWQRSLPDLVGPRSRFCFQVLSVRISFASALQFNLGITSLYLLTCDRLRVSN